MIKEYGKYYLIVSVIIALVIHQYVESPLGFVIPAIIAFIMLSNYDVTSTVENRSNSKTSNLSDLEGKSKSQLSAGMLKTVFMIAFIFAVVGSIAWYFLSQNNWEVVTERNWNGSEQRVFLTVADPDLEYRVTVSGWIWMRTDFSEHISSTFWFKTLSSGKRTSVWISGDFRNPLTDYYLIPVSHQPANCEQYVVGKPYGASIVHVEDESLFLGGTTTYLRTNGGESISVGSNTYSCHYSAHPSFRNERRIRLESRRKKST